MLIDQSRRSNFKPWTPGDLVLRDMGVRDKESRRAAALEVGVKMAKAYDGYAVLEARDGLVFLLADLALLMDQAYGLQMIEQIAQDVRDTLVSMHERALNDRSTS